MRIGSIERILKWIYLASFWVMAFTGFGNMPLYKRYYISDLPGLGWSSDFILNVYVHLVAGSILTAVTIYFAVGYLLNRPRRRLTASGSVRVIMMAGIFITGLMMALRNLPGIHYSFGMQVFVNFTHLGLVMLFMLLALGCLIGRRSWLRPVKIGG